MVLDLSRPARAPSALEQPLAALRVLTSSRRNNSAAKRTRASAGTAVLETPASTPLCAGEPGELQDEFADIRPPPIPTADVVLMEGFGWQSWESGQWWRQLHALVPQLQASGITHLWLPPPSASVSREGYLPTQLYDLNSRYGSQQELLALNRALLHAGIRPIADIVINHRCADGQDPGDNSWTQYLDRVPHPGKSLAWRRWAIAGSDPVFHGSGAEDSGEDYAAAPDLDHSNPAVRDSLVDWLHWMRCCLGFDGWRLDFVKGYSPQYVREYITRSLGPNPSFAVGEWFIDLKWTDSFLDYRQDGPRQRFATWVKQTSNCCCLFDFVLKGELQEAVKAVQYDRLRDPQGWCPDRAVTFVGNHDTGSTQQHWPFPIDHVMLGYAYILTHPGIPCLFWEHYFDWGLGEQIGQLVALRKRAGIRADSKLEMLAAEKDMYVARVNEHVMVKLGPKFDMGGLVPRAEEGWRLLTSGTDYAIWEKAQ